MPTNNLSRSTQTDMQNVVEDYQVAAETIDEASGLEETSYLWTNWSTWLGYYKKIPELKKAIDAYATWVLGKGWTAEAETQVLLEHITGWGEDTINSILWNMLVVKKINGDAFAEIVRDDENGEVINLKPLNPANMKVIVDEKGIIKRYELTNKTSKKGTIIQKFDPNQILHLCNDRIANEIHGTSVIECVQWVIDARNEAMTDWKRISHRATIRVLYVDADDTTKLTDLKRQYAEAINKGEVLIIPGTSRDAGFQDLTLPPHEAFLAWIRYLENFFYQAVGIPKVILGGSEEFTEASSKISYLTYEQIYTREVVDLEADIWNQVGLKLTFNKPASLKSEMLSSEEKNTGQVGFQPSEMMPGRNE